MGSEMCIRDSNSIYRKERTWPHRLQYDFTAFPTWLWDRFNDAAAFNDPQLSLLKIAWALMEAEDWTVSLSGHPRTLQTLFAMITGGLERTIRAAAQTFHNHNIAQGFLTSLCGILNAYAEAYELTMRMIVIVNLKPTTLQSSASTSCTGVRIELQHGIATSKYRWNTLSALQRRTNILTGRSYRSRLLRKIDEGLPQQGQAQLHGHAQH